MKYIPEKERLLPKEKLEEIPGFMDYISMIKRYRYYTPNLSVVSIIKENHKSIYETMTVDNGFEHNTLKEICDNENLREMYNNLDPSYLEFETIADYKKYLSDEVNWNKSFPRFIKEVALGCTDSIPNLGKKMQEVMIYYFLQEANAEAIIALNKKYQKTFEKNEKDYIHYLFFSERVDTIEILKNNNVFKETSINSYINEISNTIYAKEADNIIAILEKFKLESTIEEKEVRKSIKL